MRPGQMALRLIAIALCGAAFATFFWMRAATSTTALPGARSATAHPHVVIFLVDTLRADRVGLYGAPRPTTPVLDALAPESVVFENSYATSPWTLPTVVSLFTSTYLCEHGVNVDGLRPNQQTPLLAQRMKDLGYTTISLYANTYLGSSSGLHRGFDHFELTSRQDQGRLDEALQRYPNGPYFIYMHLIEPHDPYLFAPAETTDFPAVDMKLRQKIVRLHRGYQKLTRADFSARRPLGTTDNASDQQELLRRLDALRDEYLALYDAAVREADRRLATLIATLRARGIWDDTLLFVLSDHGEELGEHGGWLHDQSLYEELTRVPLLVRLPRGANGGRRIDAPATTVDVLPTLLELIGRADLIGEARGRSLAPLLRGEAIDAEEIRVVSMRHNVKKYYRPWKEARGDLNIALRRGPWKAIWNAEPDSVELYDLNADPRERHNLALQQPVLVQEFKRSAQAWLSACSKIAPSGGFDNLDEETLRELRALGYID